jgi:hypothetical protein
MGCDNIVHHLRPDQNQEAGADGNERHSVMNEGGQSHCGIFQVVDVKRVPEGGGAGRQACTNTS